MIRVRSFAFLFRSCICEQVKTKTSEPFLAEFDLRMMMPVLCYVSIFHSLTRSIVHTLPIEHRIVIEYRFVLNARSTSNRFYLQYCGLGCRYPLIIWFHLLAFSYHSFAFIHRHHSLSSSTSQNPGKVREYNVHNWTDFKSRTDRSNFLFFYFT